MMEPEHQFIQTNGIKLHCAIQGSGPTLLCLHGFPEFWYGWKNQIPFFSKKFRVVAPDMRGYNLSDKPEGVAAYRIGVLVEDIHGIIKTLGEEKVFLAAHDWGGMVAWHFAGRYPRQVRKLVILNAPHPTIFARELRHNPEQQMASQYTLLLRSSRAEEILSRNDFEWLRKAVFEGCKDPSAFDSRDRAAYLEAWSRPGALTGGVNYYRAAGMLEALDGAKAAEGVDTEEEGRVRVPTLVIWGEKDTALTIRLLGGLESYVSDLKIIRIPHATHWVQHDAPEEVNQSMMEFLD